jgi:RNA polymerase sigma factor (sigma-70 family)
LDPGSVTIALADLRASDPQVRDAGARRLWEHFAPRLCALARSRLDGRIRTREDENDIVQGLFLSFFASQRHEAYSLEGREALWRLLVRMTLCKVANVAHHHRRACRDVRQEQAPTHSSAMSEDGVGLPARIAPFRALSPEEEVISRSELDRMLRRLNEGQREIIAWKVEGFTNAEIGRRLQRTERTVELKLRRIREILLRDPDVSHLLAASSHMMRR